MVEANQGIKSWEEYLEEICAWYLEINDEKNIHKHIIGAFCDLWMIYSDKADQIIAASTSSVIP
ncbi:hypothetical protein KY285_005263 [Solanum tuberosum]|nr:hypothetical protein KY285_005263 [Solanum tuberosum]